MKLDYNILWVDDRIDERPFQRILEATKQYLIEEHFNCEIFSAKEYDEFVEQYNNKKEFDLIITDYTLNNGSLGNQVIDYVRDNEHNNTEVFFYSAQTDINHIKLYSNSRITFFQLTEGDYKELETEIFDVIHQTIKKFQHIIAMRGMIMNETSSIDAEMLAIVSSYIDSTDSEEVKNRIYNDIIDFHSRKKSESEGYRDRNQINKILKDPVLLSSNQRANALEEIIKIVGSENFINDLKAHVIKVRNNFAHAVYVKDPQTGREYFVDNKNGIDFNLESCRKIRLDINTHKKNIFELKNRLG